VKIVGTFYAMLLKKVITYFNELLELLWVGFTRCRHTTP